MSSLLLSMPIFATPVVAVGLLLRLLVASHFEEKIGELVRSFALHIDR